MPVCFHLNFDHVSHLSDVSWTSTTGAPLPRSTLVQLDAIDDDTCRCPRSAFAEEAGCSCSINALAFTRRARSDAVSCNALLEGAALSHGVRNCIWNPFFVQLPPLGGGGKIFG